MKDWIRRIVGILTLGGSFTGVALTAQLAMQQERALAIGITLFFTAIYAWGTWCGLRILERGQAAARQACVFWGLQIPHVISPVAGFSLTSGASVMLSYASATGVAFKVGIGSHFQYTLLQGLPFSIGINLLSVCMFFYLGVLSQHPRGTRPQPSAEGA